MKLVLNYSQTLTEFCENYAKAPK